MICPLYPSPVIDSIAAIAVIVINRFTLFTFCIIHVPPLFYFLTNFSGLFGSYIKPKQFAFAFFSATASTDFRSRSATLDVCFLSAIALSPFLCSSQILLLESLCFSNITHKSKISIPRGANDILMGVNDTLYTFFLHFFLFLVLRYILNIGEPI